MASLLVSFVMAGPELLAEVFLDAVVVTILYRHLKTAAKEHWPGTAVKRTWISALLTAGASASASPAWLRTAIPSARL